MTWLQNSQGYICKMEATMLSQSESQENGLHYSTDGN